MEKFEVEPTILWALSLIIEDWKGCIQVKPSTGVENTPNVSCLQSEKEARRAYQSAGSSPGHGWWNYTGTAREDTDQALSEATWQSGC